MKRPDPAPDPAPAVTPVVAAPFSPVPIPAGTRPALPARAGPRWAPLLQAAAVLGVVTAGLAAVGGTGWALVIAKQSVQGRLIAFAASAPQAPPAPATRAPPSGSSEVAANTTP